jgi:hypothetical protein
MTDSPVTFRTRDDGSEVVMLGVVDVGEIHNSAWGTHWRLLLPLCRPFGRAVTIDSARDQLTAKIEEWVKAAGLAPTRRAEIRAFRSDDCGKQAVRP